MTARIDFNQAKMPKLEGIPVPEKLTLQVEFFPASGRYSIRLWDGGRLVPEENLVVIPGMEGRAKQAKQVQGPRELVLGLCKKLMQSVLFGIDHNRHIELVPDQE